MSLHYGRLRSRGGRSDAIVLTCMRSDGERQESGVPILGRGRIVRRATEAMDDEENLASKLDGVNARLQSPIAVEGFRRRVSIYGGDLDRSLPGTKGMLSDGMGYLFLAEARPTCGAGDIGRFFLQLG